MEKFPFLDELGASKTNHQSLLGDSPFPIPEPQDACTMLLSG